jgi:serine/threonine protein kinase
MDVSGEPRRLAEPSICATGSRGITDRGAAPLRGPIVRIMIREPFPRGSMSAEPHDALIGSRIREYEIQAIIGAGAMGTVYRARHVYLDEERAIKVIKGDRAADAGFRTRFIREARILSRLRSPYLVQLLEFGSLAEHTFFMVMELLRGESVLARLESRGRFSIEDGIRIVKQAARGLEVAHQMGIIHRDISPDNLLLVPEQRGEITKVIDFGIAKPLLEDSSGGTAANDFMGKLEYCSPEQCGLLRDGERIDARTDVYSLAVTLYHMVGGRLPFQANSPQGYILKHATEPPPPLSAILPLSAVPDALERAIMRALSKDRHDRQASMAEFISQLEQVERELAARNERLASGSTAPSPFQTSHLRPGQTFAGRYVIERLLGEGGMGEVYKAADTILEVPVALKLLSRRIEHARNQVKRLKREVVLARRVAHPNVCRIHDLGESDGFHYVSMEYVDGRTLADLLASEGPLDLPRGIALIGQVLDALREAHRVGVVHRDLKPQNIMVDASGRARILDFGVSISPDMIRLTQPGGVVGTPQYMPPEQILGESVDYRADIYAVGVMMFQMFTGKLPFVGHTRTEVMVAAINMPPPRPSALRSDLDPRLDSLILKALAKSRDQRFRDASEFIDSLYTFRLGPSRPANDVPMSETITPSTAEGLAASLARASQPDGEQSAEAPANVSAEPSAPSVRDRLAESTDVERSLLWRGLPKRRYGASIPVAIIASAVILGAVAVWNQSPWSSTGRQSQPAETSVASVSPARDTTARVPANVLINAVPWARIRLTSSSSSHSVPNLTAEQAVTPCVLQLEPGEYVLELENDGLSAPRKERIRVEAAKDNSFVFEMPGHDPDRVVAAVLAGE